MVVEIQELEKLISAEGDQATVLVPKYLIENLVIELKALKNEQHKYMNPDAVKPSAVLPLDQNTSTVKSTSPEQKSPQRPPGHASTKLPGLSVGSKFRKLSIKDVSRRLSRLKKHPSEKEHDQPKNKTDHQIDSVVYQNLESKTVQLEKILAATRSISTQNASRGLVSSILSSSELMLSVEQYTLYLCDFDSEVMNVYRRYAGDDVPRRLSSSSLPKFGGGSAISSSKMADVPITSASIAGRVVITGEAVLLEISDTQNADLPEVLEVLKCGKFQPRLLYCVPIRNAEDEIVGAMSIMNEASESEETNNLTLTAFQTKYEPSLHQLCNIAGAASSNIKLTENFQLAQERIQMLMKLNRAVSMEVNNDEVLRRIYEASYVLLGAERVVIFAVNHREASLRILHAPTSAPVGHTSALETGIAGYVASHGEFYSADDVRSDAKFDPFLDQLTGHETRSCLCVPVMDPQGKVLAVIEAINKKTTTKFLGQDVLYCNYIAESAGVSLYKSLLHDEAIVARQLSEIRFNLSDQIHHYSGQSKIEKFVDLVMNEGKAFMNVQRFGLLLVDNIKNELWITPGVTTQRTIRIPVGEGISGQVALTQEGIVLENAYEYAHFDSSVDAITGLRTTSVICIPVMEHIPRVPSGMASLPKPKVVAVAMAINRLKDVDEITTFQESDRDKMEALCREITIAMGQLSLELQYLKIHQDSTLARKTSTMVTGPGQQQTSSLILSYHQEDSKRQQQKQAFLNLTTRTSEAKLNLESDLDDWSLHALAYDSTELAQMCIALFRNYTFDSTFDISMDTLNSFLLDVTELYHENPFHNFQHGFQVMHTCHIMFRCENSVGIELHETLALLVAALCHDVDHPGTNNDYEMKRMTPLAFEHNDDAVLERHHAQTTFKILCKDESNIFASFSDRDYRHIRKLIILTILSTDMSKHFDLCKSIEKTKRDEVNALTLLQWAIHAADLSGQTLPLAQAKDWGARVVAEFQNQAEAEKKAGLEVASFMENLENEENVLNLQVNFITFVLMPLWEPFTVLLPNLEFYTRGLKGNLAAYKQELKDLQEKPKGQENSSSKEQES